MGRKGAKHARKERQAGSNMAAEQRIKDCRASKIGERRESRTRERRRDATRSKGSLTSPTFWRPSRTAASSRSSSSRCRTSSSRGWFLQRRRRERTRTTSALGRRRPHPAHELPVHSGAERVAHIASGTIEDGSKLTSALLHRLDHGSSRVLVGVSVDALEEIVDGLVSSSRGLVRTLCQLALSSARKAQEGSRTDGLSLDGTLNGLIRELTPVLPLTGDGGRGLYLDVGSREACKNTEDSWSASGREQKRTKARGKERKERRAHQRRDLLRP